MQQTLTLESVLLPHPGMSQVEQAKTLSLRDYQLNMKRDFYGHVRDGAKKVLIVAGTGAGKTELATAIAQDALSKGRRVSFIVHRDNLCRQTIKRFSKYGLNPSAVHPHFPKEYDNPCQVVSIQTMARRPKDLWLLSDIVLYDEAHITSWSTLGKQLIQSNHHAITAGLTATPWRLKKTESMGDLFNELVLAPLPIELMEMGYLVFPRYFGLPGIDTSKVKTSMGDFALDDLAKVTNDPEVVIKAVDNWERLGDNRKTIAFCVNVNHSKMLTNEFVKRGVKCAHVDGTMDTKDREILYDKLASGELTVITSCEALAEGFDVPSIGCVMLCRPTKSRSKYMQQLGRGLRIYPGKLDCIVLDQAGNVSRHGFVEDLTKKDFQLSLSPEHFPGEAPVKECPSCRRLVRIAAMDCPHCGYKFPQKAKLKANDELIELRVKFPTESNLPLKYQQFRVWKREAFEKRIAPGYATVKFKEQFGADQWVPKEVELGALFNGNPTKSQITSFKKYLLTIAQKKSWDDNRIQKEWVKEMGVNSWQR